MNPEIIAGETFGREGNDCYITTTVTLIETGYQYVLLATYNIRGWYENDDAQIKWTGSSKEEGLEQYNKLVKEISR